MWLSWLEHQSGTPPTRVRFPGAARDFSPRVNFLCRLSYGVPSTRTIACIYICAHVKDPVVHVRVRWIIETLKHPALTVGWVAQLCRSWLSPGKATRISHGRYPIRTIQFFVCLSVCVNYLKNNLHKNYEWRCLWNCGLKEASHLKTPHQVENIKTKA